MKIEFDRGYKGTRVKVCYPIDFHSVLVTDKQSKIEDATSDDKVTNLDVGGDIHEKPSSKRDIPVYALGDMDYQERLNVLDLILSHIDSWDVQKIMFLAPNYVKARRVSNKLLSLILQREKRNEWSSLLQRITGKKISNSTVLSENTWKTIVKNAVVIESLQNSGERKDLQYLKRIEVIFHALDLMGATGAYPFMGYDTYPCHFAHVVGIDLYDHIQREKCPVKPRIITGDVYKKETIEEIPLVDFIFLKSIQGVHDLKKEAQWKQLLDRLSTTLSSKGYWILWRTEEAAYEWKELLEYLRHYYKEIRFPKCIRERIMGGPAFGDDRFYLGNSFRIFQTA